MDRVRVIFLTHTRWGGQSVSPGVTLVVPENLARRWALAGIAAVDEIIQEDNRFKASSFSLRRVSTSSWYDILKDGEIVDRVQGKSKAEKRVKELSKGTDEPSES